MKAAGGPVAAATPMSPSARMLQLIKFHTECYATASELSGSDTMLTSNKQAWEMTAVDAAHWTAQADRQDDNESTRLGKGIQGSVRRVLVDGLAAAHSSVPAPHGLRRERTATNAFTATSRMIRANPMAITKDAIEATKFNAVHP